VVEKMRWQKIFLIFVFAVLFFNLSFGVGEVFEITFYSEEDFNNAIVPVIVDRHLLPDSGFTFKTNPSSPNALRYQKAYPFFFVEMNVTQGKNILYLIYGYEQIPPNSSLLEYTASTGRGDSANLLGCSIPGGNGARLNPSGNIFRNLSLYETIFIIHSAYCSNCDVTLVNTYNNTPWGPSVYIYSGSRFFPSYSALNNKTKLVSFFILMIMEQVANRDI